MKTSRTKWLVAASTLSILLCHSSIAGNEAPKASMQDKAYDALKQLPDWSGVWILHRDLSSMRNADEMQRILTPQYGNLERTHREARSQANLSNCLPAGPSAILLHTIMFEFLFTPGRVTMLFEDGETRRIYTDGRAHLSLDDLVTSYMGDSIAHWEDHTLVVDTIGFPNGELWENYGVHATQKTHLVERIFLTDQSEIQIDTTLDDPNIFKEPYHYTRRYRRSTLPLREAACAQNNRDTGTSLDLTPPEE